MAEAAGGFLGAPPAVPAIPGMEQQLGDYLRRFALWCQGNFNSTLQKRTATGQIFMASANGAAFAISIDDSGRLVSTPLIPGSTAAGTPVLTFAPVVKYASGAVANPTGTASTSYVMMG